MGKSKFRRQIYILNPNSNPEQLRAIPLSLKSHLIIVSTLVVLFNTAHSQQSKTDLSDRYKSETINRLADLITTHYVLPDKADIAVTALRSRLDSGEFDDVRDFQTFANRLTGTLDIIEDWHLAVNYYPDPIREDYDYRNPSDSEVATRENLLQRRNYGFEKVERLPGNVGLLELRDFFYEHPFSEETLSGAMQFLRHTEGLIIDLRENGGGQAELVQLLTSYLIEGRVLIGTTRYREGGKLVEHWSLEDLSGPQYSTSKPVYVLVSNRTFSAAEAFTYALLSLGRITVFGEKTIGGAHPTNNFRLDEHLMVRLPIAQSIDPRTNENWQYVGIQPDYEIESEMALDLAYRTMLEALVQDRDDTEAILEIKAVLGRLVER